MPAKEPNDRHQERKLRHLFAELATPHEVRRQQRAERRLARGTRRDRPDLPPPEVLDEESWLDSEDPSHPAARRPGPVSPPPRRTPEPTVDHAARQGRVVGVGQGWARVRTDDGIVECRIAADLERRGMPRPAVGDHAALSAGEPPRLVGIAPRTSALGRPDPANPGRTLVLAANVDRVVVVLALGPPGLRAGLGDRVRLAADRGGAGLLVVVNKIDLAGDAAGRAAALAPLAPLAASGVAVVPCSAVSGEGIDRLSAALAGETAVLVGPSGVGKSSLLNRLAGTALATAAVRVSDGKGKHTTTGASLVALPGGGALIDTPGIRQFGLARPSPDELSAAFPDVAAIGRDCRFRDCAHAGEPGCAVVAAIERGELAAARRTAWLRLASDET